MREVSFDPEVKYYVSVLFSQIQRRQLTVGQKMTHHKLSSMKTTTDKRVLSNFEASVYRLHFMNLKQRQV